MEESNFFDYNKKSDEYKKTDLMNPKPRDTMMMSMRDVVFLMLDTTSAAINRLPAAHQCDGVCGGIMMLWWCGDGVMMVVW